MTTIHYFYKITNTINDHFYYGVHNTNNINDGYAGSGLALHAAYEKYGKENFKMEILKFFDNSNDAFKYESEFVNEELISDPKCYNLKTGGEGWQNEINKRNKVVVTDGNTNFMVSKDDPRYLSGELISHFKNKVVVKDATGRGYSVSKDDPRYLSGELVPYMKGIKLDNEHKKKLSLALKDYYSKNKETLHTYLKCWVYRLEPVQESKFILKAELDTYLSNGWQKGRKMFNTSIKKLLHKSCNAGDKNHMYGTHYIFKQDTAGNYVSIAVKNEDIQQYLNDGWQRGRKIGKTKRDYYKDKNYPKYEEIFKKYNELKSWNAVANYYNITPKILRNIRKNQNKEI